MNRRRTTYRRPMTEAERIDQSVLDGVLSPGDVTPGTTLYGSMENTPSDSSGAVAATVVVDDTGLHVYDGHISIEDEFGDVVATASGFGGSWLDFIALGLHNPHFLHATAGAFTATDHIPFWTESGVSSRATTTMLTGQTWTPGEVAIEVSGLTGAGATQYGTISDSTPVSPGQWYVPSILYGWSIPGAGPVLEYEIEVRFYDTDDVQIVTGLPVDLLTVTTVSTTTGRTYMGTSREAPVNARYARVWVRVSNSGSTVANTKAYLGSVGLLDGVVASRVVGMGDAYESGSDSGSETTTCTVATTEYPVTAYDLGFVPEFVGQRFEVSFQCLIQTNTAGNMRARPIVTNASLVSQKRGPEHRTPVAAGEINTFFTALSIPITFVAASTDTYYLRLYVSHSVAGATVTTTFYRMRVKPIGGTPTV